MSRYKPGATINTHLFVAALLWSLIGIFLMIRGVRIMPAEGNPAFFVGGVVIGALKSIFVLDKVAGKNIQRILDFGDNKCLGGVYSYKTWGLVLVMIGGGFLLRASSLSPDTIGLIYVAIGWALMLSSRLIWLKWRDYRNTAAT